MRYLANFNHFLNEDVFNAYYRPDKELIEDIHLFYPESADEIIYAMLSKDVDNALSRISEFIGGSVELFKLNNKDVKYLKMLEIDKPSIINFNNNYYCMYIDDFINNN